MTFICRQSLRRRIYLTLIMAFAFVCGLIANAGAENPYSQWSNGPSASPDFFPIAVWLQNPANAPRYKAAGFDLYIGLWQGPTQAQLDTLSKAGMRVICDQNKVGLENRANPIIAGWTHNDEPDNAQWGGRFGPPVSTEKVRNRYKEMRAADPSRPIFLDLGQGVAHDGYIGRGIRRNHPEDYPDYVKGCDIASFDIYPVHHEDPAIAGKLEFVANGVDRLIKWNDGKPVWNCIECTRTENPNAELTPAQVRAEVWMSLIHGSRGIIYFAHQFKPVFREAALLDEPEMLAAVTGINRQIHELAPVLNSPAVTNGFTVRSSNNAVPVDAMARKHDGAIYLFAVCMRNQPTKAAFNVAGLEDSAVVEVLGESRTIKAKGGAYSDDFKPYEVHLYRITGH
jgi:hypothetical protein